MKGSTSLDHEATWLLGHTEHITFVELWESEGDLYVDAMLHVPAGICGRMARGALHRSRLRGPAAPRACRGPPAAAAGRRPLRGRGRLRTAVRTLPFRRDAARGLPVPSERESLRDGALPHGGPHAGGPPAAAIFRSRSCAPAGAPPRGAGAVPPVAVPL